MEYKDWKKLNEEYAKHDDKVDHPDHYNKHGIETIDQIKSSMSQLEFEGYLKGNIMKYLSRFRDKGEPMKELRKAEWYLQRLIMEVALEAKRRVDAMRAEVIKRQLDGRGVCE